MEFKNQCINPCLIAEWNFISILSLNLGSVSQLLIKAAFFSFDIERLFFQTLSVVCFSPHSHPVTAVGVWWPWRTCSDLLTWGTSSCSVQQQTFWLCGKRRAKALGLPRNCDIWWPSVCRVPAATSCSQGRWLQPVPGCSSLRHQRGPVEKRRVPHQTTTIERQTCKLHCSR